MYGLQLQEELYKSLLCCVKFYVTNTLKIGRNWDRLHIVTTCINSNLKRAEKIKLQFPPAVNVNLLSYAGGCIYQRIFQFNLGLNFKLNISNITKVDKHSKKYPFLLEFNPFLYTTTYI